MAAGALALSELKAIFSRRSPSRNVLDVVKLGSYRLMDHCTEVKQRFLISANQPLHRPEVRR
jgi:hypothetical protein